MLSLYAGEKPPILGFVKSCMLEQLCSYSSMQMCYVITNSCLYLSNTAYKTYSAQYYIKFCCICLIDTFREKIESTNSISQSILSQNMTYANNFKNYFYTLNKVFFLNLRNCILIAIAKSLAANFEDKHKDNKSKSIFSVFFPKGGAYQISINYTAQYFAFILYNNCVRALKMQYSPIGYMAPDVFADSMGFKIKLLSISFLTRYLNMCLFLYSRSSQIQGPMVKGYTINKRRRINLLIFIFRQYPYWKRH